MILKFRCFRYATVKVRGRAWAPEGESPRNRVLRAMIERALESIGDDIFFQAMGAVLDHVRTLACLPRKEVIQPHLPVRLPCYDFTPLTLHTFDASAP